MRWVRVDRADVPGGGAMDLFRDGDAFAIHVDGRLLMDSREHGSEDALARLAAEAVLDHDEAGRGLNGAGRGRSGPRDVHGSSVDVLIGGLGMGYTLAAATRWFGPHARLHIAEVVPEVVRWHRELLGPVAGHPLRDERVTVHQGDVAELIRGASERWDAILLDVDNGPEGLTRAGNGWLYEPAGLQAAHDALRPGGALAVWSGWPDASFTRRLQRAWLEVEEVEVRSRGEKGGRKHTIWVARRPSAGTRP